MGDHTFVSVLYKNLYLQVTVDDERKRCQSETKLSSNVRTRATRVYIEFATSIRNCDSPLRKPHHSPSGRRWLPFLAIPSPQHSNSINIFRLNYSPPLPCSFSSSSSSLLKKTLIRSIATIVRFACYFFFSFFFFETVENVRRRKKRPAAHSTNTCRVLSFPFLSLSVRSTRGSSPLLEIFVFPWTRVGE